MSANLSIAAASPISITPNVSYDDYARAQGVRISALKEMGRSPRHYLYALSHPKTTKPLSLGSAAHCAVLEPERFGRDYAVWGERTESGNLRPRRSKDYDAFVAANPRRTIITDDEYQAAIAIQRAVRTDPNASRYLKRGEPEVSMAWADAESGTRMKGRADWITQVDGVDVLVGLKTTRDCRPFLFNVQAAKLGYHLAWAAYFDGYKAIRGIEAMVVEIVVENAAPHDVAVYIVPSDVIEQGRYEYRELIDRLAHCERTNQWPGAVPHETRIALPAWVFGDGENDVADLGLEGFEDE